MIRHLPTSRRKQRTSIMAKTPSVELTKSEVIIRLPRKESTSERGNLMLIETSWQDLGVSPNGKRLKFRGVLVESRKAA